MKKIRPRTAAPTMVVNLAGDVTFFELRVTSNNEPIIDRIPIYDRIQAII